MALDDQAREEEMSKARILHFHYNKLEVKEATKNKINKKKQ